MAVVFIALFFSVSVFLLLLSFLSASLQNVQDLDKEKRTYQISLWPKSEQAKDGISILDLCINEDLLPPIEENLNFITFSCNLDDSNWYAVFSEKNEVFNNLLDSDNLLSGRWFYQKEVEQGSAVAVLDENVYPDVVVGQHMLVAGTEVEVIGIGYQNVLPYPFMRQISNDRIFFTPDSLNVVFESEVSREALRSLSALLYSHPDTLYDLNYESAISFVLLCIGISLGAMFLIVCNISDAFKRLIDKSKPAYSVIKICGGTKRYITFGLMILPILISTVSFLLGAIFYYTVLACLPVIVNMGLPAVSGGMTAVIYLVMLLYCLLFLFGPIRRFLKGGCKM